MIYGIDRLVAAGNGETSDRIPVFCNLLDQGARELGLSLKEFYSKGEYVAEAQLRMREKYGYDNVWSLFLCRQGGRIAGLPKDSFFRKRAAQRRGFCHQILRRH